ncbi:divergent PAP2 family protein [Caldibacillus thermoamylovorans]|uniref:divergent PAP2 family protein n=1 Tax=Bacillaceae TaxID=186817 RepID=UPI001D0763FB|nr:MULTISPECIES: divergent PAP2 family protein [Bacillaceae]MCB5936827.1 divergent PAP2 family protein [Bacillus sp. DFI.2.34]MCB7078465.1 divergent PAP2 family protein [Caldibacillus thermoamylovorans]MDL0419976.1 divergent PAP2 family protein [Caldibacillus thermoamylovorans]
MNKPIITALATIGIAQFLKMPIGKITGGKWDWRLIFETGGMPSSHSAVVASLATYIAKKSGVKTIDFALASIFGLLVMYDAQGVRRQAGELSIKVNDLEEEVERLRGQKDYHYHDRKSRKLRERLGHQPVEVLGGALFGIISGIIFHRFLE